MIALRQSVAGSVHKISDSIVKSFSRAGYIYIRHVRRNWISLRLSVDFLSGMYLKDKQMLAFNFTFDLLWTGRGSSVSSVAFLEFRELK